MKLQHNGKREKCEKRETGSSCLPPVPFVMRRDVLEQQERVVPRQPPGDVARNRRPLGTIAAELNWARRMRRSADAKRLDEEFDRKLATEYARAPMPSNPQEKYEMV